MAVSKEDLFKARLVESTVYLEGLGEFRFRQLSRQEVLDFQKVKTADGTPITEDAAAAEQLMISTALVDPKLTPAEVGRWQAACSPGEIDPLTEAIAELSGMNSGASKEAVKKFR